MNSSGVAQEIQDSIAYANAQSCKLYLKSDPAMGSFLAGSEKECKVGYSTDLQFSLKKNDYYFVSLEAVSTDETQTREEYVEFTLDEKASDLEKGIYIVKVKLLKAASDILIRPVCLELPGVKSYYPASTEPQAANTSIIITFNMPVEDEAVSAKESLFNYENKNIIMNYISQAGYNVDMTTYFEKPVFNSTKNILTLCPKGGLLKSYIEDEEKVDFIDINISFSEDLIIKNEDIDFKLKQDSNSSFTVRYNSNVEETAPVCRDFFIAKEKITLADAASFDESKKLVVKSDLSGDENIKNLIPPYVYIYGKYYDKDSGVRTIVVTEQYTYSLSKINSYPTNNSKPSAVVSTLFTADSDGVEFKSDENGYTEFVIKYNLREFLNENPRSGVFYLTVTAKDGCDNKAEQQALNVINLEYGDLSYYERINKSTNQYVVYKGPDRYDDLGYAVPKPFFLYNTPFSKSSTNSNRYDFEKYYSDIKNIRIKDEVMPTYFRIYTNPAPNYSPSNPGKISCNDVKYICEYTDKNGTKRSEPFSDFTPLTTDTMERSVVLDVDDKVSGLSFTVIVEYEGIILGRKTFYFPDEPLMEAVETNQVKQKPLDDFTNVGYTGIYQNADGSYNLLYAPMEAEDYIKFQYLSEGCNCYLGYYNGHYSDKNYSYNNYKQEYDHYSFNGEEREYKRGNYWQYNPFQTINNTSDGCKYEDVLLGEIAGPFNKNQTAITKPAAPVCDSYTITKSTSKAGYLDVSLYFDSDIWDSYDFINLTGKETKTNTVIETKTITSENTVASDDKKCFTFSVEQSTFYDKGKVFDFDISLIGVKSYVQSDETISSISLGDEQQSAFDDTPPSELLIKYPRTIDRTAVFYFYDNGSGPKSGTVTLNGKSYGTMEAEEPGSNTFIIEIPYYKLNAGNNTIEYVLYDNNNLKTEGTLNFNAASYAKEDNFDYSCIEPLDEVSDDAVKLWIRSDYLISVLDGTAYLAIAKYVNNKWDTPIKITSSNIQYCQGAEDPYQLKDEVSILPAGSFYKICYSRPASSTEEEYVEERVICALKYDSVQNDAKSNYVLANGTDNASVIISSVKPVYVNICSTNKPYATCKDWSADMWELMEYATEDNYDQLLDLSQTPNTQVFEIPTHRITSGHCYCVVVHFANGKTVRSQVMY